MERNGTTALPESRSSVSIDRIEQFATTKMRGSGSEVVESFIGPIRHFRTRTPAHPLRRKVLCADWHGSITTDQHVTKIFLRHDQLGRILLRFYDDSIRKPLGWIYIRHDAPAFDYCGHSAPITDQTVRTRRAVQIVLQSLRHCLAISSIDLTTSTPFAIPLHHPRLTDGRLRPSSDGKPMIAEYFPLIDRLGIRNISTPIDLQFPCEAWYALYNTVHDEGRRRRTQRRELMKLDSDLAAALMMQTTDLAECIGLGYAGGRGRDSRAVCLRHPNGTNSVAIGPHGSRQASYTVSARSANIYNKSACIDDNPQRKASRHHVRFVDLSQRKYDTIIRHDGQVGRVLLKRLGWTSLESLLDMTLGELAKVTLSPISVRCRSVAKIRHAIAEPQSHHGRHLQRDEAASHLHMVKLVLRYYQALARACGSPRSGKELPSLDGLLRRCRQKRISVARLARYVDECFQDFNRWMEHTQAVDVHPTRRSVM